MTITAMVMPTNAKPHEGARVNWIHWIERIGLFGLLSAISIGLGLDSASAISPALVEGVPKIFRSQSSVVASNVELAGEDFATAYESASAAVLKQPLDPEALFATGVAANELGKRELASSAVGAAAGLGWRNIAAQVAVLQGAVNQRQWQTAAPRIAAIVRLDRLDLLPPTAVLTMLNDPVGTDALAKEFAREPNGWSALSRWLAQSVGAIESVRFLSVLPDATKVTDCGALADQATRLLGSSDNGYVDAVWEGSCAKGHSSANVISFPGRTSDDGIIGPYDWKFPPQGAISYSLQDTSNGPVIVVRNSDPVSRLLAQRLAKLSPGTNRITVNISNRLNSGINDLRISQWLRISINCAGRSDSQSSGSPMAQIIDRSLFLEIPKHGCSVQRLQLHISPGEHPAFKIG